MVDFVLAPKPLQGAPVARPRTRGARILVIGLGDMAQRMATTLVDCPGIGELIWAGRHAPSRLAQAHLLSACGAARVRFVELDALHQDSVTASLSRERPDLVLQCGSLLSPWALSGRTDPLARAIAGAGFAVQLPAQLPIVLSVMRAMRAADLSCPVVNCSYPDVTHHVLSRLGLAPTIGVGNAGMIRALVLATLKERDEATPLVRVLGHHSHVTSVVTGAKERCAGGPRPRVYLGEAGDRADDLAYSGVPIPSNRELNMLSAAHAQAVVRALLPGAEHPLRTSAPGPHGLPGGFPVVVEEGEVVLDLPASVSLEEALVFQAESAALDGIREIRDDGTVVYTDAVQDLLRTTAPELAEPLHPDATHERFALLSRRLERGTS